MRARTPIALIAFWLLSATASIALGDARVASLTDATLPLPLGSYLEVLEAPEDGAGIEQVAAAAERGRFRPAPHPFLLEGNHPDDWLRFEVRNDSQRAISTWLGARAIAVDRFTVYRQRDGQWRSQRSGRTVAPLERALNLRRPAVPLALSPGEHAVVYIHIVQSDTRTDLDLSLRRPGDVQAERAVEHLVLGLAYGFLLAILLYTLARSLLGGQRAYLFYAAMAGSVLVNLTTLDGTLLLLGLPSPRQLGVLSTWSIGVFALLFLRDVLDMPRHTPRLHRALRVYAIFFSCWEAAGLVWDAQAFTISSALLIVVGATLLVVAAAVRARAGDTPAQYYLLGWLVFVLVLGPIIWLIAIGGEPSAVPLWSVHLAMCGEAFFAFLALAERTRLEAVHVAELNEAGSRFVPNEFLRRLGRQELKDVASGDRVTREMTVWFSDVRSFTSLVEHMTPEQTMNFVNDYLTAVEPIITAHGGFIDKFIGDAVMALFDDPDDAVEAAVACLEKLRKDNVARAERGEAEIHVGVGLHTGPLILGTVGSPERLSCTVLGDSVNLASRVEGMTKLYGAELLITEETRRAMAREAIHELREVDRVAAKGKTAGVTLHEVLDAWPDDVRARRLAMRDDYAEARRAFVAGELAEATERFAKLVQDDPTDPAVTLHVERCETMASDGMPPDWNGVVTLTSK